MSDEYGGGYYMRMEKNQVEMMMVYIYLAGVHNTEVIVIVITSSCSKFGVESPLLKCRPARLNERHE